MNLLVGIGLVLMGAVAEVPVDVTVTLEPPEIPFHKKAVFTIVVEAPDASEIGLPEDVERFGGLGVVDATTDIEPLKKGRKRYTQTYVLDAVFMGDYAIAPVTVVVDGGEEITVPSPLLRVRDLTDEEREKAEHFETIAGPISPKKGLTSSPLFWLGIAVAAVALVGLVAWLVARRWRGREIVVPKAKAWEVAYQRLEELDKRQLPKTGKYGAYYVDLSAILRYYIEDRFSLRAPEETTPEFVGEAARSGKFSKEQQHTIASFLRHCDRVKFARYKPTLEEMDTSFSQVLVFVDETVPRSDVAAEEAAA